MKLLMDHHIQFRVYVENTDAMGIVYHANYLCFFERARTELLRSSGVSLSEMARSGTHFAVHKLQIRYAHPARLDDLLNIQTHIEEIGNVSIDFEQSMYNENGQLLSDAKIRIVSVSDELKLQRMSKHFLK